MEAILSNRRFEFTDAKGGAAFTVRVVTRAPAAEFAGFQDDGTLKIRLTAPSAGDPAANEELVSFLAGLLGIPVDRIEIVAGLSARDKLITIDGLSPSDVETLLGFGDGSA